MRMRNGCFRASKPEAATTAEYTPSPVGSYAA